MSKELSSGYPLGTSVNSVYSMTDTCGMCSLGELASYLPRSPCQVWSWCPLSRPRNHSCALSTSSQSHEVCGTHVST